MFMYVYIYILGTFELGLALLSSGLVIVSAQVLIKKVTVAVGAHGTCVVAALLVSIGELGFYFSHIAPHLTFYAIHTLGFGFINTSFSVLVSQYAHVSQQGTVQGYLASAGNPLITLITLVTLVTLL